MTVIPPWGSNDTLEQTYSALINTYLQYKGQIPNHYSYRLLNGYGKHYHQQHIFNEKGRLRLRPKIYRGPFQSGPQIPSFENRQNVLKKTLRKRHIDPNITDNMALSSLLKPKNATVNMKIIENPYTKSNGRVHVGIFGKPPNFSLSNLPTALRRRILLSTNTGYDKALLHYIKLLNNINRKSIKN